MYNFKKIKNIIRKFEGAEFTPAEESKMRLFLTLTIILSITENLCFITASTPTEKNIWGFTIIATFLIFNVAIGIIFLHRICKKSGKR